MVTESQPMQAMSQHDHQQMMHSQNDHEHGMDHNCSCCDDVCRCPVGHCLSAALSVEIPLNLIQLQATKPQNYPIELWMSFVESSLYRPPILA
ncbi:MAG: hypothetical protein ACWA5R_09405 [bacterium]